jgi:hypothetical protein
MYLDRKLEVQKESAHTHAPNQEEVAAEKTKSNLKRIAVEHPELPPAQILRTELPKVSTGVLSQLPERENLKKSMRRERAKDQPRSPMSLEELAEIPDRYDKKLITIENSLGLITVHVDTFRLSHIPSRCFDF